MQRVPLAQLQTFVEIVRAGKLSVAAKQMSLTVSALSHQMQALESAAKVQLLVRESRGVQVTPAGKRLLDAVKGPLAEIRNAWAAARENQHPDGLTISALPSIASGWLMQRLPRFTESNPQIQLSLLSSAELVDFEHDDVDLAIRHGAGTWPGLTAHHMMDEYLTPLISPNLLEKHLDRLGAPELATLHLWPLLGDPSDRWNDWAAQTQTPLPSRFIAYFSDTETLHRAALEGLGIALGRMSIAQSLIAKGLLRPLTHVRIKSNFAHFLVYPERSKNKASVQLFRDWLLTEARQSTQSAGTPLDSMA